MWLANRSMETLSKQQNTRIPLGKTHGGREEQPQPISNIVKFVKHIKSQGTSSGTGDRTVIGAQGRRNIDIHRKDAPTTWKWSGWHVAES